MGRVPAAGSQLGCSVTPRLLLDKVPFTRGLPPLVLRHSRPALSVRWLYFSSLSALVQPFLCQCHVDLAKSLPIAHAWQRGAHVNACALVLGFCQALSICVYLSVRLALRLPGVAGARMTRITRIKPSVKKSDC